MPEPTKLLHPFAYDGDRSTIPDAPSLLGYASMQEGFPRITQIPIEAGGSPPRRLDFNSMFYLLTVYSMWNQQGGLYEYDAVVDYERSNMILQNGALYFCVAPNGPSSTVISPESDTGGDYWKLVVNAAGAFPASAALSDTAMQQVLKAVYPVGSFYFSANAVSPDNLFGFGTWQKIEGRFLLGASSSYALGSNGGAATVKLAVNNLPPHSHTVTAANAGNHNHTASSNSTGAHQHTVSGTAATAGSHNHAASSNSAGAHTHTATTANAGAHTHTRGTMDITGKFRATDNDGVDSYATGAFTVENVGSGDDGSHGGELKRFTFTASRSWTGATSSAGTHGHTITVNSAGAHSHTITVNNNGAHTHSVSGTAASAGAHSHTITVNANGTHTHAMTCANTGSGTAFSIMPPYLAVNIWKRVA